MYLFDTNDALANEQIKIEVAMLKVEHRATSAYKKSPLPWACITFIENRSIEKHFAANMMPLNNRTGLLCIIVVLAIFGVARAPPPASKEDRAHTIQAGIIDGYRILVISVWAQAFEMRQLDEYV